MLNRIMLSAMSLATLTVAVTWPVTAANAMIRPLSPSSQSSIQFSNGLFNHGQFVERPSDDLSGLMITGCSQFGTEGPQVCLQWLGDALSTCLEWGEESVITACMQKGNSPGEDPEEDYGVSSAQSTSRNDWGFSLEFTLQ